MTIDKTLALNQSANGVALAFVILAAFIVVGNYFCIAAELRNRRQNSARHVSRVPLLAQIFAGIAIIMLTDASQPWIPVWSPLLVGCADPSFWELLYLIIQRRKNYHFFHHKMRE